MLDVRTLCQYTLFVKIEFDSAKNERNVADRGLTFGAAADFDFASAVIVEDTRRAYPERRFQALGHRNGPLHVLVFSPFPDGIRVISFRRANKREVIQYEKATQS